MKKAKQQKQPFFHKYHLDIDWSEDDQCFVVTVPELPGCQTHGDNLTEAVAMANEAIEGYVTTLEERGLPVPEPIATKKYSGNFHVRMDPALHRKLAIRAAKESKPINKVITSILADHSDTESDVVQVEVEDA